MKKTGGCLAVGCVFALLVAGLVGSVVYMATRRQGASMRAERAGRDAARGAKFDLTRETPPAGATSLVLILDTSGSMNERVSRDDSKLAVAKEVLTDDFLPQLSDDLHVALWRFDGDRAAEVSPLRRNASRDHAQWLHREALMEMVDALFAEGGTPICDSLESARESLEGLGGRRIVVLVTDGEESVRTKNDVLEEIDENQRAGIETYIVGFNLGDQGSYLAQKLGLGRRYFQANGGRDALLKAMAGILAEIEK